MEAAFVFGFAALGAVLASFTGVVVERIHTGQSWVSGRSRCDSCGTDLSARELVPVLSWAAALGRCRICGVRVSAVSTLFELITAALFVAAYLTLGLGISLGVFLGALAFLLAAVRYDLRHTVIPYAFSIPLIICAALFSWLSAPSLAAWGAVLATAGAIGTFFALAHLLSGGRAMGLADAPIALALSLLVGPLAFSGFVFSFWIGAVIGIAILVRAPSGHKMGIEVPLAPFLAAGFLLAFFTGWSITFLVTWIVLR